MTLKLIHWTVACFHATAHQETTPCCFHSLHFSSSPGLSRRYLLALASICFGSMLRRLTRRVWRSPARLPTQFYEICFNYFSSSDLCTNDLDYERSLSILRTKMIWMAWDSAWFWCGGRQRLRMKWASSSSDIMLAYFHTPPTPTTAANEDQSDDF